MYTAWSRKALEPELQRKIPRHVSIIFICIYCVFFGGGGGGVGGRKAEGLVILNSVNILTALRACSTVSQAKGLYLQPGGV